MVWHLMFTFVARLSGGLAAAMLAVPSRDVASGFFRVHLWALLGLFTFGALLSASRAGQAGMWPMIAGGVVSYVGSVLWLYEKPRLGKLALLGVVVCATWGLYQLRPLGAASLASLDRADVMRWLNHGSSAMVLGVVLGAMLLGHWYLNTPTMRLAPLRRLILILFAAVMVRAAVVAASAWTSAELPDSGFEWAMFSMQWLAGILAPAIVTLLTWQMLLIPNTQSATGMLYVGVIVVFLGEMAGLIPAS